MCWEDDTQERNVISRDSFDCYDNYRAFRKDEDVDKEGVCDEGKFNNANTIKDEWF
jgi:hypothetical protein